LEFDEALASENGEPPLDDQVDAAAASSSTADSAGPRGDAPATLLPPGDVAPRLRAGALSVVCRDM